MSGRLEIMRCGYAEALDCAAWMGGAPSRGAAMADQILASVMWKAVDASGAAVAVMGLAAAREARLCWLITSPALRAALPSFIRQGRALLRGLRGEPPIVMPVTARGGARLARLLGAEPLARCRDGRDYWIMEG